MEKLMITNELSCAVPEGFRLMTDEEADKFFTEKKGVGFAVKNEQKHAIIAVYALKMNFLVRHFTDDEAMMNGSRAKIERSLTENDYGFDGEFSEKRFNRTLYGFKYRYVVDGIPHNAGYLLLKGIKYYYGIQYFSQSAFHEENERSFNEFRDSLELGL